MSIHYSCQQELNKVWSGAQDWAKHSNAFQKAYHGGEFTGNGCKRLLSQKSRDYLSLHVPIEYYPFVNALTTFEKLVKSCYGYKLASTYKADIASFASAYRKLNINDTTKIHIVTEHLVEFIERAADLLGHESGLAPFTGLIVRETFHVLPFSIVISNHVRGSFPLD